MQKHTSARFRQVAKTYVQRLFSELVDGRQALVVDVVLQQVLQLAQAVGNPGNEKVHPAEVVVLVVVQKVLELRVEDLQVLLDQNFVAGLEQTVQGRLVQIDLRKEIFLIETLLIPDAFSAGQGLRS